MNNGYNGYTLGVKGYTNYYFFKKRLQPYMTFQMGYDYRKGDNTFSGIKTNYSYNTFYTAIGGGLNWRITSKLSFFTASCTSLFTSSLRESRAQMICSERLSISNEMTLLSGTTIGRTFRL